LPHIEIASKPHSNKPEPLWIRLKPQLSSKLLQPNPPMVLLPLQMVNC
jgi:hypothetical protein